MSGSKVDIRREFPPNIDAIRARFPLTGSEIFAYDNAIYHPGPGHLTAPLIAHEQVHFKQQESVGGADVWWKRYINDNSFRYEQELEAHRKELEVFAQLTRDRNKRWRYATQLARRMNSPMYGINSKNVWTILQEIVRGTIR